MHTHFANCQEVVDYICGHFGEDENSERCRELKKHLDACPDCSTYCDSMDKMIGLYRAASPCFPEDARKSLLAALGVADEH
ncbi:MAG TPA: hypothetical protein PK916_06265 [Bacteroidota bacterium]|jgi:hypothetical protein|nr:hypothetical protein [Bacteroidota bacterium]